MKVLYGWGGLVLALVLVGCAPTAQVAQEKKVILVTYSVLGSLVKDLAGDQFEVHVSMPNGLDVHEWEPSAKDIETLNHASLIVRNGLGLEGGMEKSLANAEGAGVPMFVASEHVAVRTVKADQGLPTGDPDQAVGAKDPHLWMDPLQLKSIVFALAAELKSRFATDLSEKAAELGARLQALDAQIRAKVAALPEANRLLVTGHESLGYFADAYGFALVGAIVPGLSDQAQVSAAGLSSLEKTIRAKKVKVIFTELGTPPQVSNALGKDLGVKVVEITTHALLPDGSYFTFLSTLADTILSALKDSPTP